MNVGLIWLLVAVIIEVIATTFIKATEGFTRLIPTILVLLGYGISFFCLSQVIKTIPTGIAYAIWSGVGIVLVNVVAWLFLGQRFDIPAIAGITLIITGVLCIQLFSKMAGH